MLYESREKVSAEDKIIKESYIKEQDSILRSLEGMDTQLLHYKAVT
jgi:hypothetical protein